MLDDSKEENGRYPARGLIGNFLRSRVLFSEICMNMQLDPKLPPGVRAVRKQHHQRPKQEKPDENVEKEMFPFLCYKWPGMLEEDKINCDNICGPPDFIGNSCEERFRVTHKRSKQPQ
jgi:hypothetical protein